MRLSAYLLLVCLVGCNPSKHDYEYWTSTAVRYADSSFSRSLSELIQKIEEGDLSAWDSFAAISKSKDLDGEHSQVYSVACSELLRRDPTFFLRRYLDGDSRVLFPARCGYGWSGQEGRSALDSVYARRLYISRSDLERNKIGEFIEYTASTSK